MSVEAFQQFAVMYGAFALIIVLIWRVVRDQTRERDYFKQEETTPRKSINS
ncbi:MAG: hypothetical protein O7G84_07960 [Gammaproteobacteria bacterium]|jgi:flagellar biogenesis protein FliO|nr:hypothetical protein [Gammaproteobacteria bacterium]